MFAQNAKVIETNYNNNLFSEFWLDEMFWNVLKAAIQKQQSHFGTGVLLHICCIFSKHFFLRTPLNSCFSAICRYSSKKMFLKTCNIPRKAIAWRPVIFINERLQHRCFPVITAEFLRIPFSQNMSGRLFQHNYEQKF